MKILWLSLTNSDSESNPNNNLKMRRAGLPGKKLRESKSRTSGWKYDKKETKKWEWFYFSSTSQLQSLHSCTWLGEVSKNCAGHCPLDIAQQKTWRRNWWTDKMILTPASELIASGVLPFGWRVSFENHLVCLLSPKHFILFVFFSPKHLNLFFFCYVANITHYLMVKKADNADE